MSTTTLCATPTVRAIRRERAREIRGLREMRPHWPNVRVREIAAVDPHSREACDHCTEDGPCAVHYREAV